ncbi:MAG: polar amino acid transport system permease protein [Chloroflexota bacterium]|nr:polar amino acid transport system permease protein [Chloroflexota bacterium]
MATWIVLIGGFVLSLVATKKFDIEFLATWAVFILGGAPLTVAIAALSIALATGLAVLGALGRLSRSAPIYAAATLYVSFVRGTPLVVQILFLILALPQIVPASADVPLIVLGIVALAFNYGAYMTEIFRAGIQAVPRGQREAAEALGMPERLVMRRILLPQAVRIVIPPIGNEFIAMLKDSALLSIVGVQELLWRAETAGAQKFRTFETLTLAAAVYWVMTIVFTLLQERLERRMAAGDR